MILSLTTAVIAKDNHKNNNSDNKHQNTDNNGHQKNNNNNNQNITNTHDPLNVYYFVRIDGFPPSEINSNQTHMSYPASQYIPINKDGSSALSWTGTLNWNQINQILNIQAAEKKTGAGSTNNSQVINRYVIDLPDELNTFLSQKNISKYTNTKFTENFLNTYYPENYTAYKNGKIDMSIQGYTIWWYVLKLEGNTWHVDGVVVPNVLFTLIKEVIPDPIAPEKNNTHSSTNKTEYEPTPDTPKANITIPTTPEIPQLPETPENPGNASEPNPTETPETPESNVSEPTPDTPGTTDTTPSETPEIPNSSETNPSKNNATGEELGTTEEPTIPGNLENEDTDDNLNTEFKEETNTTPENIPMQNTGVPIASLILAILLILTGYKTKK